MCWVGHCCVDRHALAWKHSRMQEGTTKNCQFKAKIEELHGTNSGLDPGVLRYVKVDWELYTNLRAYKYWEDLDTKQLADNFTDKSIARFLSVLGNKNRELCFKCLRCRNITKDTGRKLSKCVCCKSAL